MKPNRPIKKNPSNITAAIRQLDRKNMNIIDQNQEPVNEMTPDQLVITDCVMRMLANRPIPHCLNISFSVINTLAMNLPKEGRNFIVETLKKLAESIDAIDDAEVKEFKQQTTQH